MGLGGWNLVRIELQVLDQYSNYYDTESLSISFSPSIRANGGCALDSLKLVNTGVAATFSNIAVRVIKN